MSTCGEIIANTLLIVPRPELETLVRAKLNQIVSYISKSGYFWRDIVDVTIGSADGVDPDTYIQSIPITTKIRAISYLKYPDRIDKINRLDIQEIVTNWEVQNSCCYLSSSSLRIKHEYLTATFDFGYYSSPDAFALDGSEDSNSNWITDLCAGLVEDLLAAYVLTLKGETKDAATIAQLANMMKQTYIRDFVTTIIN